MLKKLIVQIAILILALGLTGCREKAPSPPKTSADAVELTVYNVFDNEDIFEPLFQAFRSANPGIRINYRKFNDVDEYRDLIVNELAEGEGPDIFFLHNSWFLMDHKKLMAAPNTVTRENFESTFVDIAASDLIIKDEQGIDKVYSFPLYVDTLALYYNKKYYNEKIPERGRPPRTWSELEEDIFKLKKEDNSFERFKVAGIAMGRADNILRAKEIFLTLLLQNGANFYDKKFERAIFAETQGINSFGKPNTPGIDALTLYTSFGLPTHRNYTWNSFLSSPDSAEKEINTFARGKVAMILGYSYLYQDIAREINVIAKRNPSAIEVDDVAVAEIPQVFDPEEGIGSMASLASYFSPAVSRTSEHPSEAWLLINFITNQENARYYNEKTKRPTARRDLVAEQGSDPIYGIFAKQVGYAKSIPMVNPIQYNEIFEDMINRVIGTVPVKSALQDAEDQINALIPKDGLFPLIEPPKTPDKKDKK